MLNLLREQLESVCRHSPTLVTSSYITSRMVDSPFIICHVQREEKLTVRVKKKQISISAFSLNISGRGHVKEQINLNDANINGVFQICSFAADGPN